MSAHRDRPRYGPEQPHPLSTLQTELVWEGKYDEYGDRRQPALPAQPPPLRPVEQIGAPGDQPNLLLWADNKLALQALLEPFRGQVKLIAIDPPFDIGGDVTMDLRLGGGRQTVAAVA